MTRLGLYIHWPYCQAKCPYCDFNSHVVHSIDMDAWADAYLSEIKQLSEITEGRVLSSVFFGGGTPSLMSRDLVARVMDAIRSAWPIANDWEVTLEANPTSVEADRFAAYRMAGVNRISMGAQALNDTDLRRLGRLHTVAEARDAFAVARDAFDRVSFDLIYARQDQSLAAWEDELGQALEMSIDHLSLYQLTIEPGTAFGDRFAKGGLAGLPDEDLAADMYELTQRMCNAAGMPAYEVSNHARPGAESQHNLIYWTGADYIGIGPGAHGRLTLGGKRYATVSESAPVRWLSMVSKSDLSPTSWDVLSTDDQISEALMMGLRLNSGVALERLAQLGADLDDRIAPLVEAGFLKVDDQALQTTSEGRIMLNAVLRELIAG